MQLIRARVSFQLGCGFPNLQWLTLVMVLLLLEGTQANNREVTLQDPLILANSSQVAIMVTNNQADIQASNNQVAILAINSLADIQASSNQEDI